MQWNWHEVVDPTATVLHLGDVQVWYNELEMATASRIVRGLPGKKFLIKGNHDKYKDSYYEALGFTVIPEFITEYAGRRFLFSHYPDVNRLGEWDVNIHGHIHNSGYPPSINRARDYRNISVEVMDYTPVRFSDVIYNHKYEASRNAGIWAANAT
jgi:calcineurin-like phosphoesterase family protein